jgi:hypothetical protein
LVRKTSPNFLTLKSTVPSPISFFLFFKYDEQKYLLIYPVLSLGTGAASIDATQAITIATTTGTSALTLQNYTDYYGVSLTTSAAAETTLWSNDYLLKGGGTSASIFVTSDIAAVCGASSSAAGYKSTNIFYYDGGAIPPTILGSTYTTNTVAYGASTVGLGSNMTITTDGVTTISLKMTPFNSEVMNWQGKVEVITSKM